MRPAFVALGLLLWACADPPPDEALAPGDASLPEEIGREGGDAPREEEVPRGADTDGSDEVEEEPPECAPAELQRDEQAPGPEPSPDAPPKLLLTVNEIPRPMNGSQAWTDASGEAHPFSLRVNHENFTLDLMAEEGSGEIDWESLSLVCDSALSDPEGGILLADTPIPPEALSSSDDELHRRLVITPDAPALDGVLITCEAEVAGPKGTSSDALSFETAALPEHLDPFVTPDTWLVVLSRDIAALSEQVHADKTVSLTSAHRPEGDGVIDFDEGFIAMGLFSEANVEARGRVKSMLLEVVRDWAYRSFLLDTSGAMTSESVPIRVLFEGDPEAPDPQSWDGTFSMIALGGDGEPHDQLKGTVGMAKLDPNNQAHEDNTLYGLGVFTTGIVRQALKNPLATLLLASILPHTGTPIGDHPEDALLLDPDFDPKGCHSSELMDRYTVLGLCLEFIGLAIGATLAHEIGHSLGLVPPGPPPIGLFAGVEGLSFTDNTLDDAHIDTPGLNVMQTGRVTNWLEALSQDPSFNALNLAYLRRRLVVGP